MKKNKLIVALVILIALGLGACVGSYLSFSYAIGHMSQIVSVLSDRPFFTSKTAELMEEIERQYVDSIDINSLDEATLQMMLRQLDPHSTYTPAKEMNGTMDGLDGSFSGIGIQFNMQSDTINVVKVISNGPSQRAGLAAGDKIVTVNDSIVAGMQLSTDQIFHKLRGKKGTSVTLGVLRAGTNDTLHFDIVRDDIPVNTVLSSYIVAPGVGYILVDAFGQKTYEEFLTALAQLRRQKATRYIVDLRGNGGGYLEVAAMMLNEFLNAGDQIVYIEGTKMTRQDFYADGTGSFIGTPIVVLIDEFSASASEIFAGAVQDNDRGTIIGRRSFGKGLVQRAHLFSDGSEARLTVARYYTPSGRCIQKPYEKGNISDYETELWNRYLHGEFYNADSIHLNDSSQYLTSHGRVVYGGGGIMPDIFIPRDTSYVTPLYTNLINRNIIYTFANKYTNQNRASLSSFATWQELEEHLKKIKITNLLYDYARKEGVNISARDIAVSNATIQRLLTAYIVRNFFDDEGFYPIFNRGDIEIDTAINTLLNQ